jgi:hypothetical protein
MEGDAIHNLAKTLDSKFVDAVELILNSDGRIVVTGVGKSADVGRKIVATLNSTGSPAMFVHAGDAVHGDLGGIQKGDVVIFSHGGPIKAAIAHAIKADPSYTLPFWVDNLSLSRFDFIDGVCRVRFVNLLPKIISNSSNAYERFL